MGMARYFRLFVTVLRMNEVNAESGMGDDGQTRAGAGPETGAGSAPGKAKGSAKPLTVSKVVELGFAAAVGVIAYFTATFSYMYAVVHSIWVPIAVAVAAFVALALRYSTPVWSFASVVVVCVMTVFIGAPLLASMVLIALLLFLGFNSVAKRCTRKTVLVCMFTGMGLSLLTVLWWGLTEGFAVLFLMVMVIGLWGCYERPKS